MANLQIMHVLFMATGIWSSLKTQLAAGPAQSKQELLCILAFHPWRPRHEMTRSSLHQWQIDKQGGGRFSKGWGFSVLHFEATITSRQPASDTSYTALLSICLSGKQRMHFLTIRCCIFLCKSHTTKHGTGACRSRAVSSGGIPCHAALALIHS